MKSFKEYLEKIEEFGVVEEARHPLSLVAGLPGGRLNEIVIFETGQVGQIFVLNKDKAQILLLDNAPVKIGTRLTRTGEFLSVPVGDELLGQSLNPLGIPVSKSAKNLTPKSRVELDQPPLAMSRRVRIKSPFYTNVMLVDMMVPLGKGQKELVIGDRKTGKSTFILQAINHQVKNDNTIIIYALIAKKKSEIKKVEEYIKEQKLQTNVIIVATNSNDSPSLINITPFAAMSIAEYFRDQGRDCLVVLDDLSTHAKFYREISLIAKRFPGRDSYPGDIFYTHARLLERAGNFQIGKKTVSVTVLPVAETIEADFTGYIATNLMSMTDGHIFFDSNLYSHGRRPAINIELSVTRVGRQAQQPLLKDINHQILAFLTQYEKVQNLSHFGAELNMEAQDVLATGGNIYKFFEQLQDLEVPLEVQLVVFGFIWTRILKNPDEISGFRKSLNNCYAANQKLINSIASAGSLDELAKQVDAKKEELLKLCKIPSK